jgi:hypothetical protein
MSTPATHPELFENASLPLLAKKGLGCVRVAGENERDMKYVTGGNPVAFVCEKHLPRVTGYSIEEPSPTA